VKEFYTTKEFAELLSVHPRTVIKLIHAKKIRAVNVSIGNKPVFRILCKEYLRFIAEENFKE
jgi:excisionase family DNA binding protein